ncbi:MAG: SpoIID/LytB domain-containing protein [Anaerosacchariphilus sp.]
MGGRSLRKADLERCVAEILPMQIPVTYEPEALKAQAVVIRTNLLRAAMEYYGAADWQQAAENLQEKDLAALGFTACTEGEAAKLWSYENRQRYLEKCRTAAEETAGQVLALEGESEGSALPCS